MFNACPCANRIIHRNLTWLTGELDVGDFENTW